VAAEFFAWAEYVMDEVFGLEEIHANVNP